MFTTVRQQCIPRPPILEHSDSIQYQATVYAWVIQEVSALQISLPNLCLHFSFPPYKPRHNYLLLLNV